MNKYLAAALAATTLSAYAQVDGEFIRPVCGTDSILVVSVQAEHSKDVTHVLESLGKADRGHCVQPGSLAGTWVLEGTRKSMFVGIMPVGAAGESFLRVVAV